MSESPKMVPASTSPEVCKTTFQSDLTGVEKSVNSWVSADHYWELSQQVCVLFLKVIQNAGLVAKNKHLIYHIKLYTSETELLRTNIM